MSKEREVLDLLVENARYSTEEISRMTDIDEEEVEEIISEMENEGVVKGYRAVVDYENLDSEPVSAYVEVNISLDRETGYEEVARSISRFPNVKSMHLVSGNYDFGVVVEDESMQTVSDFVSEKIAPVPEVTQTVTHFIMDTYKDRGFELIGEGDDDRLSVSP
ncbi:MAG: Lrp/AsnC family transcriptional regulator [Halobacteria archaeon]